MRMLFNNRHRFKEGGLTMKRNSYALDFFQVFGCFDGRPWIEVFFNKMSLRRRTSNEEEY